VSALSRRERDGLLTPEGAEDALTRLDALRERWDEIEPAETVRRMARRLLRVHPLRGGGALQLAAGLVASEADPANLRFVSLDERLADAAQREGFQVVPQQQV
jgi:predicted nucleic acid-binding protein